MCCAWSFSFGKWLLFHVGRSLRLGMMIVTEEKFSKSFPFKASTKLFLFFFTLDYCNYFQPLGSSKMTFKHVAL